MNSPPIWGYLFWWGVGCSLGVRALDPWPNWCVFALEEYAYFFLGAGGWFSGKAEANYHGTMGFSETCDLGLLFPMLVRFALAGFHRPCLTMNT